MSENTARNNSEKAPQRPGPLLKEAREKMGLSRKDIASQLNLQQETIAAIEEDRTELFPAATYARGYIRSYARIVKLDGEEMIRLFDNEPLAPPEIIPDIKTSGASSHDKPVRAVTYLVTFILALLLVAWLQSNYVVQKNAGEMPAEKTEDTTSAREPGVSAGLERFQERPGMAEVPPTYQPEQDRLSDLRINEQVEIPEADEGIIENMALSEIAGFETDTAEADMESLAEPEETADTTTEDRLVLNLTGESWIEVYDSGNNRLYLGMGKKGEEIRLSGFAPFHVLLGYSPVVEVTYNGRAFDTKPHEEAGVARFTLGEDSHNN